MDKSIKKGCPLPRHVPGHPEKRKPNRDHWLADDWGNHIADRSAAGDFNALVQDGLEPIVYTIQAVTLDGNS